CAAKAWSRLGVGPHWPLRRRDVRLASRRGQILPLVAAWWGTASWRRGVKRMKNLTAGAGHVRTTDRMRERPRLIDGRRLEALMGLAAHASARQLLAASTEGIVELLGARGLALLIECGSA